MARDSIHPNVPGLDTSFAALSPSPLQPMTAVPVTVARTRFAADAAAGVVIAALLDPFGSGSTFTTVGAVPPQLALSGSNIVKGAGAAVVGTEYAITVLATAPNGRTFQSTIQFRGVLALGGTGTATPTPTPTPALALSPTAPSIAADVAAGTLITAISNVPTGVTPTVTPNDGRFVIAGDAGAGWKVVKGMTALSAGTVNLTIAAAGASSASAALTITAAAVGPVLMGLTTDPTGGDVDDQLVLANAAADEKAGRTKLLFVIVHGNNGYGAPCVEATLKQLWERNGLGTPPPVFARQTTEGTYNLGSYPQVVAEAAGLGAKRNTDYPSDVVGYRTMLAQAPGKVAMATVGGYVSEAALIASPADAISPLTGAQLWDQKVLAVSNCINMVNTTNDYNLARDIPASMVVMNRNTVPFIGTNGVPGEPVRIGAPLYTDPADYVQLAMDAYAGDKVGNLTGYKRQAYDPMAWEALVDFALGITTRYEFSEPGQANVTSTGNCNWTAGGGGTARMMSKVGYAAASTSGKAAIDAALAAGMEAKIATVTKPIPASFKSMVFAFNDASAPILRDTVYPGGYTVKGAEIASTVGDPTYAVVNTDKHVLDFTPTQYLENYGGTLIQPKGGFAIANALNLRTLPTGIMHLQAMRTGNSTAITYMELRINAGKLQVVSYANGNGTGATLLPAAADLAAAPTFPVGTWALPWAYHDGTTLSLYLGATLLASVACPPPYAGPNNAGWQIGAARFAGIVNGFDGQMSAAGIAWYPDAAVKNDLLARVNAAHVKAGFPALSLP